MNRVRGVAIVLARPNVHNSKPVPPTTIVILGPPAAALTADIADAVAPCTVIEMGDVVMGAHRLAAKEIICAPQRTGGCTTTQPSTEGKNVEQTMNPHSYGENKLSHLLKMTGYMRTGVMDRVVIATPAAFFRESWSQKEVETTMRTNANTHSRDERR
jgi:hypothetical protein